MTDTGRGLFRAILDDPDDNDLYMVYSDWLEENGQEERAFLIRKLVEYHKGNITLTTFPEDKVSIRLALSTSWAKEYRHLQKIAPALCRVPCGTLGEVHTELASIDRGFMSRIRCDISFVTYWLPHVVSNTPLRSVEVNDKHPIAGGVWSNGDVSVRRRRWRNPNNYTEEQRRNCELPEPIFKCLPEIGSANWGPYPRYGFDGTAEQALSVACLRFAIKKAKCLGIYPAEPQKEDL